MKGLIFIFSWIFGFFDFLAVMVPVQWLFGSIRAPGKVALVSGVLGMAMFGLAVLGTRAYDRLKAAPQASLKEPK